MKRILPFILLIGGIILFALAFMFYQKSESIKRETDTLRELTMPPPNPIEDEVYEPTPEPAYDPADLDQTPPGIAPFITTSVCIVHWGNHLRQYCDGGDSAELEIVEGGYDQAETMRTLKMCLNDLVQRWETYKTDDRPMDSPALLNESNRKAIACGMTQTYGNNPIFNDSSIYYMVKEHKESGNISRLENR